MIVTESEVAQSCPTLCDPVDCSLPRSSVHGIFQARLVEWIAISFPGDLPNPGIEPGSSTLEADALTSEPPGTITKSFPVSLRRHRISEPFRITELKK